LGYIVVDTARRKEAGKNKIYQILFCFVVSIILAMVIAAIFDLGGNGPTLPYEPARYYKRDLQLHHAGLYLIGYCWAVVLTVIGIFLPSKPSLFTGAQKK
jgi:heme/copper-type cytochrome/quinol oxidase subunit 4